MVRLLRRLIAGLINVDDMNVYQGALQELRLYRNPEEAETQCDERDVSCGASSREHF